MILSLKIVNTYLFIIPNIYNDKSSSKTLNCLLKIMNQSKIMKKLTSHQNHFSNNSIDWILTIYLLSYF